KNVFKIVCAFQWNLGDLHDLALAIEIAKEDAAVVRVCALFYFFLAAEPVELSACTIGETGSDLIISVEHSKVVALLVLEDSRLRVDVVFKCLVAVEMVGSDIKNDRDLWAKIDDSFQLKAGNFEDNPCIAIRPVDETNRWRTDVASDE